MEIRYRPRFEREYKKLPKSIRQLSERKEKLFRRDPFDLKLKTHKLHGPLADFYAFSIDRKYRVIFALPENGVAEFYSIGDHDIYD